MGLRKRTGHQEGNADLSAFLSGLQTSGAALDNFIFDNVDIPRQLNYLAAGVLTQNDDNSTKNYYLYRDSEGSGEWTQLPWDLDLTWGSHFMTGDSIAHDGIWATEDSVLGGNGRNVRISPSHPFVGIQELPPNRNWNRIADKLFESERFKDMFRRRLRTLMDELFAPPLVDDRISAIEQALGNDVLLDKAKWASSASSSPSPRRSAFSRTNTWHRAACTCSRPTSRATPPAT